MPILTEEYLENLFQRHRDEHQRKRNCKRVRAHMLKLPRNTVFIATRHGIVAEGAEGSRRLISWKGNLLIFQGSGFRRVRQANTGEKKKLRHVSKQREVARKIGPTRRLRVRAAANAQRSQLIPQSSDSGLDNPGTRFGSQTVGRYRRRPDDYEAADLALRMWD
jgi:hypothetical protein